MLLNVSKEETMKMLWEKLGNLNQSNSMVNKLFLQKKLYLLGVNDGDLVREHLNAFNTIICLLSSKNINITKEEMCISLMCSFPNSWDNLVMDIGSNNTTLKIDDVVATLLLEEMRRQTMEGSTPKVLSMRGQSISRKKGNPSSGRSKSRGKSRSR